MKLKEAAYIIGKLGGRPPINTVTVGNKTYWSYKGGFGVSHEAALLQEDGISLIILEDGSGFLLLE